MSNLYFGDNGDPYSGNGKIWEIAGRYNSKSRVVNEGKQTKVRRRKVKSTERVGVL